MTITSGERCITLDCEECGAVLHNVHTDTELAKGKAWALTVIACCTGCDREVITTHSVTPQTTRTERTA